MLMYTMLHMYPLTFTLLWDKDGDGFTINLLDVITILLRFSHFRCIYVRNLGDRLRKAKMQLLCVMLRFMILFDITLIKSPTYVSISNDRNTAYTKLSTQYSIINSSYIYVVKIVKWKLWLTIMDSNG